MLTTSDTQARRMGRLARRVASKVRRNRRVRGDAGAALVEYALGVALLIVFTIPAVSFLQDESSDVVERRAAALGSPDLGETGTPVTLPPPSTTVPGGSIPPPPESVVTITSASTATTVQKNVEWAATVAFTAVDDIGNEREAVTLSGEWTGPTLGSPVPMSCSTNLSGVCALTLRSLSCPQAGFVTLTITSVSGEGVTYNDALPIVVTVNRPTGTGQNACG